MGLYTPWQLEMGDYSGAANTSIDKVTNGPRNRLQRRPEVPVIKPPKNAKGLGGGA